MALRKQETSTQHAMSLIAPGGFMTARSLLLLYDVGFTPQAPFLIKDFADRAGLAIVEIDIRQFSRRAGPNGPPPGRAHMSVSIPLERDEGSFEIDGELVVRETEKHIKGAAAVIAIGTTTALSGSVILAFISTIIHTRALPTLYAYRGDSPIARKDDLHPLVVMRRYVDDEGLTGLVGSFIRNKI
jgi:hypothetical protein